MPFIEITTHPYTIPVSLRGRYYYRSGSTKMELTGNALIEFLLKKSGKTWDDVKEHGSINNSTYQELNEIGKTVTTEELQELVAKEVFVQTGTKGRGSKYELVK